MTRIKAERETSIVWDEEEKLAHIYTASPFTMRKLDRLCEQFPDEYKCVWTENGGKAKKYTVSSRYVRFAKPASEAQRAAALRTMEKVHVERSDADITRMYCQEQAVMAFKPHCRLSTQQAEGDAKRNKHAQNSLYGRLSMTCRPAAAAPVLSFSISDQIIR